MRYAPATLGLTLAPSPAQAAADWIHANYARFMSLGARISNMRARTAAVQDAANVGGARDTLDAADELQRSLGALYARWRWTADRVRWVADRIPGVGLGWIIPVAVSAVAIAVAGVAALLMRQADNAEEALRLLEEGVLTPEQARAIGLDLGGSPLFSFGAGAGTALVAGAALYFWLGRRR